MTDKEQRKAPVLRFKGFTDDWEQRKLGELFTEYNLRISFSNEKLPLWSLTVQKGLVPKSERYNRDFLVKKHDYFKIVPVGYFIYNPMNITLGAIDLNKQRSIAVSGYYIVLKSNQNFNKYFLLKLLTNDKTIILYKRFSTGSLLEKQRLQFPNFAKIKVNAPNFREQSKIGNLLKKLDMLLFLQQRKFSILCKFRRALIYYAFPNLDNRNMIIKSKINNNNLQKNQLKKLLFERKELIYPSKEYPLMSFIKNKGIVPKTQRYNRAFLTKGKKKYKKTKIGDFIYSSNNLDTGSIGVNHTGNAVISPVYSIFTSKNYLESQYIGILSKRKDFIAKMLRFRQGVVYGQWKIPEKDFLNITIFLPDEPQQKNLINLITTIDLEINMQQKKISRLQQTKQFFLQNMFI